jgi:hypothetical protein
MQRAPHDGQNPRLLRENATSLSWAQSPQPSRRKPWARMPRSRKESISSLMKFGSPLPVAVSTWATERSRMLLHDDAWSTYARPQTPVCKPAPARAGRRAEIRSEASRFGTHVGWPGPAPPAWLECALGLGSHQTSAYAGRQWRSKRWPTACSPDGLRRILHRRCQRGTSSRQVAHTNAVDQAPPWAAPVSAGQAWAPKHGFPKMIGHFGSARRDLGSHLGIKCQHPTLVPESYAPGK